MISHSPARAGKPSFPNLQQNVQVSLSCRSFGVVRQSRHLSFFTDQLCEIWLSLALPMILGRALQVTIIPEWGAPGICRYCSAGGTASRTVAPYRSTYPHQDSTSSDGETPSGEGLSSTTTSRKCPRSCHLSPSQKPDKLNHTSERKKKKRKKKGEKGKKNRRRKKKKVEQRRAKRDKLEPRPGSHRGLLFLLWNFSRSPGHLYHPIPPKTRNSKLPFL